MTDIVNSDLQQFMVCAFRYALASKSGLATDMLEKIEQYWQELSPTYKAQIKGDIRYKIEQGGIGKEDLPYCERILVL